MENHYDPNTNTYSFPSMYPDDMIKAQEIINSALEVELVRDEHKDDTILGETFENLTNIQERMEKAFSDIAPGIEKLSTCRLQPFKP